ncbi:hypothetical protein P879_05266, partial [Paragonimus westermani]
SLSIVNVKYRGVFTYLSPSDWSCKIPEYLYGNPDASYKHILESWNYWRARSESIQDELPKENATLCNTESTAPLDNSVKHLAGSPIKKSPLRRLSKHDRSTQYSAPSSDDLDRLMDTDVCDSNMPYMEMHPPKSVIPSEFTLPKKQANCLVAHTNTTGLSSPVPCCCGSDCHRNRGTAARNHSQYLSSSRANSELAEYSRFRASRSFLHGRTDLDWYTDNPELAPSASAILLGRSVLAPNQDDGGKMYLGTVLAQVGKAMFLVNFGRVNEPKHSELIQEVSTCDLLSYVDLYRHSVNQGDFVLVPQSKLETEGSVSSRKDHFLDPFLLARVIDGQESRLTSEGEFCKFNSCMSLN